MEILTSISPSIKNSDQSFIKVIPYIQSKFQSVICRLKNSKKTISPCVKENGRFESFSVILKYLREMHPQIHWFFLQPDR